MSKEQELANSQNAPQPIRDIMQYESDIWAIADLLIAAGIKQSKFPDYMMPFFALVMLEGRMRKAIEEMIEEEGVSHANPGQLSAYQGRCQSPA